MTSYWNEDAAKAAREKLDALAKPPGSLGKLEEIGIQCAGAQAIVELYVFVMQQCRVVVFGGDHGVTEENVSPYPSSVTLSMIKTIEVVNVGAKEPLPETLAKQVASNVKLFDEAVALGTKNLAKESAMTLKECKAAMEVGEKAALRASAEGIKVLAIGEMGIGNTTPASALAACIMGVSPENVVGPGTGLAPEGVKHKVEVVKRALKRKESKRGSQEEILADLGGLEIAAMTGCMLKCMEEGIVIVVDGFISTAAALVASQINNEVSKFCIFSTLSAEQGHKHMLNHIDPKIEPLLNWGLRLGEASGAALVLPSIYAIKHDRTNITSY